MLALLAVLVLLAAVLQSTLVAGLDIAGGRPELVLLAVLAWAMLRGPSEGVVAGVLGGFALDSLSGLPFGMHTGILGIIGFSTGLGEGALYRSSLPLLGGVAIISTVVYLVALALLLQALGLEPPGIGTLAQVTTPSAVLDAVLMPPTYWLARRMMRWFQGWRQVEV
jgi:rod shape-determining protein MreD